MVQSLFISEAPCFQRGGKTTNTAVSEAQNANVIPYNGRYLGMLKVLPEVPETLHAPQVYRYNMDADGLQDNGTLRTTFNGRNAIPQGANPMINFGSGSWAAPLDSYIRSSEVATASAGAFTVGVLYEIKSVGTTDFTLIGASSNTVGVLFTATDVGAGDGTASEAIRWTETTGAGGLLIGKKYEIVDPGTSDFTTVGAAANTAGTIFTATDTTSGTGTAQLIAQSGDFVVGCFYVIDTVGTTDFTSIGASSNTVGVVFQATGTTPGGTGVAKATAGARHGDMAGSEYVTGGTYYQDLWINVYDYKNAGTNRLVRVRSDDGFATNDGGKEILSGASAFGSTVADVIQRPGTGDLYMLRGVAHGSRGYYKTTSKSTDGGNTWTDTGSDFLLSDDPASPRYYGLPVGRFIDCDTATVWFSAPASRVTADRPEANLIIRATWAELDAGTDWTLWDKAPSFIRSPIGSGCWNADYVWLQDGTGVGVHNVFGMQTFSSINSDMMNTARDTSTYYGMGAGTNKHTTALRTINRLAIEEPAWWPFVDGDTVKISSFGQYLGAASAADGSNIVLLDDPDATLARWVATKVGEVFWRFDLESAPTLSISTARGGSYANSRAIGLPFELNEHDAVSENNNIAHHFSVQLIGGNSPRAGVLVNRKSSLGLHRDCSQQPILHLNPHMVLTFEVLT